MSMRSRVSCAEEAKPKRPCNDCVCTVKVRLTVNEEKTRIRKVMEGSSISWDTRSVACKGPPVIRRQSGSTLILITPSANASPPTAAVVTIKIAAIARRETEGRPKAPPEPFSLACCGHYVVHYVPCATLADRRPHEMGRVQSGREGS